MITSQAGSSLVDTLMAMSILVMSSFVGINSFSSSSNQMKKQESLLSVNDAVMQLSSAAVSLPGLQVSAKKDQNLRNCLQMDGRICLDNGRFRPITLLDPSDEKILAKDGDFLRYDGTPCSKDFSADRLCAIKRSITYKPLCSGIARPGAGCDIASSIVIKYELSPSSIGNDEKEVILPFYKHHDARPFKPISLVKDVSISIYGLLANLNGKRCPIDQKFTWDVLKHVNTHQANAASVGYNAQGVAPLPFGYHQMLQGVSWNGELICRPTGAMAGSSVPGPRGPLGPEGRRGAAGPQGPRGGPEPNCTPP